MEESVVENDFERAKAAFVDGLRCHEAGDHAKAELCYLESLRFLPGRVSTLINLAATQLHLGRSMAAIDAAEKALALEPDSTDALLHRSHALSQLGRLEEALISFERLLSIDAQHAAAWSSKGEVLRELRRFDESARAYRHALDLGGDPALNAYYLAAVAREAAPPAPPPAYVQGLFDHYADDFDKHLLEDLHYDGHRQLIHRLQALDCGTFESALDIGCGTGLCGPLVRPLSQRLTGVDISARMLEKARSLGLYDQLAQADAVDYLRTTRERHDLLLACDVFIYVGALEPLFEAAGRVMERGIFCFSLEALVQGDAAFRLETSLRYSHRESYVLGLAARHGFEVISVQAAPVRSDQNESVAGLYVYLRRQPRSTSRP